MIIKGSSCGHSKADTVVLARHLLAAENEHTDVLELRGVVSSLLPDALEEMRLVTSGSRVRRGLYHSSVNLDRTEAPTMGQARWLEAADELERRLGLGGHQRAIVLHVKRGREHIHIVWCRVHPVTLILARDSQNYRRHEECSRTLEERWGLRAVVGVHTRTPGAPRPVALATHADWQASERTGIAVRDVADALRGAWSANKTGRAFAAAVQREGFQLAVGRRGIVAVDGAGTPHSLPRRLGLRAEEVRRRLADIDKATLPTVDELKVAIRRPGRKHMNTQNTTRTTISARDTRQQRGKPPATRTPLTPAYWKALGYEFDEREDVLIIRLPNGTLLEDRGDLLTLQCAGEPTDEEIRLMVAAGKARGWTSIRLFNGSPEFQRRARLEALRQGYSLSQISLECEDGTPQPLAVTPMPDHIRNKLAPPLPPTPTRRQGQTSSGKSVDRPMHHRHPEPPASPTGGQP